MNRNKKSLIIKRISLILAVFSILAVLSGCSSNKEKIDGVEAPEGMVGVTNDAIHFTVCYPQNWLCDRNDGMVSVSPPAESGSKASVSVHESYALAEATTATEYWEKSKAELEASGSKCNFIESREMKLADADAIEVVYGMEIGGNTYKVTQIFAYKYIDSTHRVFTITFTGTATDYENKDVTDSFKSIVSSIAFK